MWACREAIEWVGDRSLERAWTECERADWMLWAAIKVGIDRKVLVLAACDCAETALKHVPKGEDRPERAIATARAWARGKASMGDVCAAADDAAYAYAYASAAYAASAAAAADAAADDAAYAAAHAAHQAALAAYDTADADAAAHAAHRRMATLVRRRITVPMLRKAIR